MHFVLVKFLCFKNTIYWLFTNRKLLAYFHYWFHGASSKIRQNHSWRFLISCTLSSTTYMVRDFWDTLNHIGPVKNKRSVTIYPSPWHCVSLGSGLLVNPGQLIAKKELLLRKFKFKIDKNHGEMNLAFFFKWTLRDFWDEIVAPYFQLKSLFFFIWFLNRFRFWPILHE